MCACLRGLRISGGTQSDLPPWFVKSPLTSGNSAENPGCKRDMRWLLLEVEGRGKSIVDGNAPVLVLCMVTAVCHAGQLMSNSTLKAAKPGQRRPDHSLRDNIWPPCGRVCELPGNLHWHLRELWRPEQMVYWQAQMYNTSMLPENDAEIRERGSC